MKPVVSIIMPIYKAKYLADALDSVRAQTFSRWELVAVLDNPPDRLCYKLVKDLADAFPEQVQVVELDTTDAERAATCRYATCINIGFQHSRGQYITYLTDDDFYHSDRLDRMVLALKDGAEVVYGSQDLWDEENRAKGTRVATEVLTDAYEVVDFNSVMHIRDAFEKVGGWPDGNDVWLNADAHFWRRLTNAGYIFEPVPGATTDVHRFHRDGVDARIRKGKTPYK